MTFLLLLSSLALPPQDAPAEGSFRVATFNCSLNRSSSGDLVRDLSNPDDPQARNLAEVLQRVRPDIVLLNEFDYDPDGEAARLFRSNYLAKPQSGSVPIDYPFAYVPPVNTGVPSGLDLDNDGQVSLQPGSRGFGNDTFGFGQFPGQYGIVLLSRFPILDRDVRSFQTTLWKDLPNAQLPKKADGSPWFDEKELACVRVSSKTHCDIPVEAPGKLLHILISHPTPPAFDGPEKRNVARNRDEIRLWVDYLSGGESARYLFPSSEPSPPDSFVLLGDLNADPSDGSGDHSIIQLLLSHPRVNASTIPHSPGAAAASKSQAGRNTTHRNPPDHDTADFDDRSVGNLRVDYVLPSKDWTVTSSGVFWPSPDDPLARLVAMAPKAASSDHRLVWLDLKAP